MRTLVAPTRLLVHTMLGGGQTCQFNGHTGKCATKEEMETGDVATAQRGTNGEECE